MDNSDHDLIDVQGIKLYKAMTGPGMPPLQPAQQEALSAGLQLLCMGLKALCRIADAADALQPARPVHTPLDGM